MEERKRKRSGPCFNWEDDPELSRLREKKQKLEDAEPYNQAAARREARGKEKRQEAESRSHRTHISAASSHRHPPAREEEWVQPEKESGNPPAREDEKTPPPEKENVRPTREWSNEEQRRAKRRQRRQRRKSRKIQAGLEQQR